MERNKICKGDNLSIPHDTAWPYLLYTPYVHTVYNLKYNGLMRRIHG